MLLLPFYNNYIISKMCHVLLILDFAKKKKITTFLHLANILDEVLTSTINRIWQPHITPKVLINF